MTHTMTQYLYVCCEMISTIKSSEHPSPYIVTKHTVLVMVRKKPYELSRSRGCKKNL